MLIYTFFFLLYLLPCTLAQAYLASSGKPHCTHVSRVRGSNAPLKNLGWLYRGPCIYIMHFPWPLFPCRCTSCVLYSKCLLWSCLLLNLYIPPPERINHTHGAKHRILLNALHFKCTPHHHHAHISVYLLYFGIGGGGRSRAHYL